MDSPEPSKTVKSTANSAATTFPDSSPVQESPFSNYVSSLSPINPLKAAHVPQGILGLSSPPLVFTSPRTVPHRETTFLQRSQLSQISSLEISEKYDGSKTFGDNLEESDTYSRGLIADTQKDNDVENTTQDQPGSSSGCVDEYLNDPVDVDCANSVALVDQNVKQSNDMLQSSLYGLNNSKSDNKNYVRANVDTSQAQSKQAEEDPHGQSIYEIKPVQVKEKQSGSKHPSKECPNIKSDLTMDHDLETNQCDALGTQENEDYGENMRTTLQGSNHNVAQCDLEVSQLQRGLSRRCLQFEEARRRTNVNCTPSSNLINNVTGSGSTTSATELLTASSIKKQVVNLSRPSNSTFALHCPGNSPMVLSKPSGIGLHLNSVPLPMGGHSAMTINKSTPVTSSYRVDSKSYSSKLSKLVEKVTIGPKDGMLQMKASIADSAVTSESFTPAKPLHNLQQPEYHATPLNKRNFNSEQADNFEEFSQLSLTKKKRKTSSSIDGDGCKRCNCKKSKCLKLYCDCFAAGIYCAEPCACQGCFNRPEYEDTVLETRQQIESRNPLAFAPKVVQHGTEAVSKEDGSGLMPSFARHKRGCNCKKSMCLKKYCECYQANVGCSSECRCEECKNVYGRKEEYDMNEEIVNKRVCEERLKGRDDDKLGRAATDKDLLHAELYELHNLTPSTPSFQHSDHGKDAPKSRFNSSRYIPSPESDFSILPSYTRYIGSPRNSLSNDMIPERNKERVDIDSFGQGMDYNASEVMDQFSPRYNALYDNCDHTPSRISSITNVASSASSKTRDCVSGSRFQLCSGGGHFPSGRSLKWRSSPITPMPRLGETKNQSHDSDSRLHDILGDDTPEILKEASTPIPSVKASSPNKKRVSPPHNHVHGLRSSSSVGLKSGRKFILTAVSSSPSLVPCDKSNGSTDDKGSNK